MKTTREFPPLTDETVYHVLSVLLSFPDKASGYEFALVYWSKKYPKHGSGSSASIAGRNLLFKLRKAGYVVAFKRSRPCLPPIFVFSVSDSGLSFLSSFHSLFKPNGVRRSLVQPLGAMGQGGNQ